MEFIDLKPLRVDAGLTQQSMADHLGVSIDQIIVYEQDPDDVPSGKSRAWQAHCADVAKNRGIAVGLPRTQIQKNAQRISSYIQTEPTKPTNIPVTNIPVSSLSFAEGIQKISRKPRIGVFGEFDAGKSTLCNIILGGTILPTNYQPTTSVVCLIRHIDDKPKWQPENVWIFKEGFDLDFVDHEKHSNVYKINAGGYELLEQLGTHSGQETFKKNRDTNLATQIFEITNRLLSMNIKSKVRNTLKNSRDHLVKQQNYINDEHKPFAAVVYVDSPILQACDLLDSPGYGNSKDDHARAEMGHKMVDALIYMSKASGFFSQNDMNHLSVLMKHLPMYETQENQITPLRNLLIVATRSGEVGGDANIAKILERACSRSFHHHDLTLQARSDITKVAISEESYHQRFFSFDRDNPILRSAFINDLKDLLINVLPNITLKHMNGYIQGNSEHLAYTCDSWINSLNVAINKGDQANTVIRKFDLEEPERSKKRKIELDTQKVNLSKFKGAASGAENIASKVMRDVASESAIKNMIVKRYTNSTTKKLDIEQAKKEGSSYLIEQMQKKVDELMKKDAAIFTKESIRLVDMYESDLVAVYGKSDDENKNTYTFHPTLTFITSLSSTPGFEYLHSLIEESEKYNWLGKFATQGLAIQTMQILWLGNATLNLAVDMWDGVANFFTNKSPEERLALELYRFIRREKVDVDITKREIKFWLDIETKFTKTIETIETEYFAEIERKRILSQSDQKTLNIELTFAKEMHSFFTAIPGVIQNV